MSRLLAKHWAIALVISLGLNLFLGGMMAARWMREPPGGAPMGRPHLHFDGLREALGPEARDVIDQVQAKHSDGVRQKFRAAMAARRAATEALTAEPFEADKARQAHDELLEKEMAARHAMHEALVELAAGLPAEQRAKLGKAMRKRGKGGRHGRDGRGRGGRARGRDGRGPPPEPGPPPTSVEPTTTASTTPVPPPSAPPSATPN